ncbi:MAG: hypothetical protein KDC30_12455 [Saprospiraceae bacterium]|nr:hypothetical protein [Saprospiraceae bacterium]
MKTLLITLFALFSTTLIAQQAITWKGGTPGRESDWNEPRNWSTNCLPNEFSDLIIPDVSTTTFSTPVIKEGIVEINSLTIASNSKLTIQSPARLIVYSYLEGVNEYNLVEEGALLFMSEQSASTPGRTKNPKSSYASYYSPKN